MDLGTAGEQSDGIPSAYSWELQSSEDRQQPHSYTSRGAPSRRPSTGLRLQLSAECSLCQTSALHLSPQGGDSEEGPCASIKPERDEALLQDGGPSLAQDHSSESRTEQEGLGQAGKSEFKAETLSAHRPSTLCASGPARLGPNTPSSASQ